MLLRSPTTAASCGLRTAPPSHPQLCNRGTCKDSPCLAPGACPLDKPLCTVSPAFRARCEAECGAQRPCSGGRLCNSGRCCDDPCQQVKWCVCVPLVWRLLCAGWRGGCALLLYAEVLRGMLMTCPRRSPSPLVSAAPPASSACVPPPQPSPAPSRRSAKVRLPDPLPRWAAAALPGQPFHTLRMLCRRHQPAAMAVPGSSKPRPAAPPSHRCRA